MAIQGHRVNPALLPLLTQHTQLGHSHRQHPERAPAAGKRRLRSSIHGKTLSNPALLKTCPTQELTPMYTVVSFHRNVLKSKGKSRQLGSRSLPLWHLSEVESGALGSRKRPPCVSRFSPAVFPKFATAPSCLSRKQVLSPPGPAAGVAVLQQTPSFHYPFQPPTSPESCLKSARGCHGEEQQVFDQDMIPSRNESVKAQKAESGAVAEGIPGDWEKHPSKDPNQSCPLTKS